MLQPDGTSMGQLGARCSTTPYNCKRRHQSGTTAIIKKRRAHSNNAVSSYMPRQCGNRTEPARPYGHSASTCCVCRFRPFPQHRYPTIQCTWHATTVKPSGFGHVEDHETSPRAISRPRCRLQYANMRKDGAKLKSARRSLFRNWLVAVSIPPRQKGFCRHERIRFFHGAVAAGRCAVSRRFERLAGAAQRRFLLPAVSQYVFFGVLPLMGVVTAVALAVGPAAGWPVRPAWPSWC